MYYSGPNVLTRAIIQRTKLASGGSGAVVFCPCLVTSDSWSGGIKVFGTKWPDGDD